MTDGNITGHLLVFEVSPGRELDLVPDHLPPLLHIHGQVGHIDAWHVSLCHLYTIKRTEKDKQT